MSHPPKIPFLQQRMHFFSSSPAAHSSLQLLPAASHRLPTAPFRHGASAAAHRASYVEVLLSLFAPLPAGEPPGCASPRSEADLAAPVAPRRGPAGRAPPSSARLPPRLSACATRPSPCRRACRRRRSRRDRARRGRRRGADLARSSAWGSAGTAAKQASAGQLAGEEDPSSGCSPSSGLPPSSSSRRRSPALGRRPGAARAPP